CVADWQQNDGTPEDAARRGIARLRAEKQPIPGFGHPQHSEGDPRANLLLKLARERGVGGPHVAMLYALPDTLPGAIGRSPPIHAPTSCSSSPANAASAARTWPCSTRFATRSQVQ